MAVRPSLIVTWQAIVVLVDDGTEKVLEMRYSQLAKVFLLRKRPSEYLILLRNGVHVQLSVCRCLYANPMATAVSRAIP